MHRNPNILFSKTLVAVLYSSGHLLILEVTNCETKVAGKALYVCKEKSACMSPSCSLSSCKASHSSLCVCVHAHARGFLIATNGSVPFLLDLSECGSVQCSALCLTESLRSLKAFRRVSKKQHTHITENTWEMRKREIMQHAVTFGSFLSFYQCQRISARKRPL